MKTTQDIVFVCPNDKCEPQANLENCERCFEKSKKKTVRDLLTNAEQNTIKETDLLYVAINGQKQFILQTAEATANIELIRPILRIPNAFGG